MGIRLKIREFFYKQKVKKQFKTVVICKKANIYNSKFEGYNKINYDVKFINGEIGIGSYIGSNSNLNDAKIGRFSSIGNNIKIISGRHPINTFVSTHPAFYSLRKQAGFTFVNKQEFSEYKKIDSKYSVIIGNDVWIGENVSIMEGIKIGDGAVIGANSLVTKDIDEYTVSAGIPCKKIKNRFSNTEIEFLKRFKWWDKEFKWIKLNYNLFRDVQKLIENNKENA